MTVVLQTRIEDWSSSLKDSKPVIRRSKILNESATLRWGPDRPDGIREGVTGRNHRLEAYWRDSEYRETGRLIYRRTAGRTRPPPSRARIVRTYHPYVRPSTDFARR